MDIEYALGAPRAKWRIDLLDERYSVLSGDPVSFGVAASANGLVYDPTSATASAAFLPAWGNPAPGDWHPCTWDVTTIGTYRALITPGVGGLALPVGTYFAWLKVDDSVNSGEIPVQQVGRLIIQ